MENIPEGSSYLLKLICVSITFFFISEFWRNSIIFGILLIVAAITVPISPITATAIVTFSTVFLDAGILFSRNIIELSQIIHSTVSKSLLTVMGTLQVAGSLPAKNDREKHRNAGFNRSRVVWSSQQTRLAHASRRPCTSPFDLPAVLTYLLACASRRTCGRCPHLLLYLLQQGTSVNGVTQVTLSPSCDRSHNCTVRRFALVKAHGFTDLPDMVTCKRRNLDLPAVLVSLDNSCRRTVFDPERSHFG